jgi:hypothetical protein
MMRWFAFVVSFAMLAVAACGDNMPPILGDSDASQNNDVYVEPCATPTQGCPCTGVEAGVAEICGTEFHYAGTYVTCSKQYITCQDDGTWSACVGSIVLGAE